MTYGFQEGEGGCFQAQKSLSAAEFSTQIGQGLMVIASADSKPIPSTRHQLAQRSCAVFVSEVLTQKQSDPHVTLKLCIFVSEVLKFGQWHTPRWGSC